MEFDFENFVGTLKLTYVTLSCLSYDILDTDQNIAKLAFTKWLICWKKQNAGSYNNFLLKSKLKPQYFPL